MAKPEHKVYPVAGFYLNGVPAAPLLVSAEHSTRLIRTGAFTDSNRGAPEGGWPTPVELTDEGTRMLEHYDAGDSPPPEATDPTEGSTDQVEPLDSAKE